MIKIDGNDIVADETHSSGIKLPSWLKTGQTLAQGANVYSVSVIEFTVNGTALDYSQNISVTTVQTVPANKVWKIESIHKNPSFTPVTFTYSTPGAYTFTPTCSGTYHVKVWGGGGGGGRGDACAWCWCNAGGSGGGSGGYTEGDYFLVGGTGYPVTVGAGGAGGSAGNGSAGGSSVFNGPVILTSTFGAGGTGPQSGCSNVGGAGGTGSGGQINYAGQAGNAGNTSSGASGKGGDAPSGGGLGGNSVTSSVGPAGAAPGAGGAGGGGSGSSYAGGAGAAGKVEISLGGGTGSSSRVPCVVLYQYSNSACSATTPAPCPGGWTDAGCGVGPNGSTISYCRTCYKCD